MALFVALAAIVALAAVAVYFFGIPPELKRKMERQALKTMGENKMSYVVKGNQVGASIHLEHKLICFRPN